MGTGVAAVQKRMKRGSEGSEFERKKPRYIPKQCTLHDTTDGDCDLSFDEFAIPHFLVYHHGAQYLQVLLLKQPVVWMSGQQSPN